ncbi:MAG: hypothetical protein AAF438_11255 [Pseudomonadota bacterium]
MNLVLSLVALVMGPLLYGACQRTQSLRGSLDGLLFVTIVGLVFVHIVPDVFEVAGATALLFLAAGLLVAILAERAQDFGSGDRYGWIVALGAIALVVHAVMDGIALLPVDHSHAVGFGGHHGHSHGAGGANGYVAFGVILHRIPVGMAIWWAVRPRLGQKTAVAAIFVIAIATSAAYILGEPVVALMEDKGVACFQAFVAGTLLHVMVFKSVRSAADIQEDAHVRAIIGERLGVVVGIILLFLVPHGA